MKFHVFSILVLISAGIFSCRSAERYSFDRRLKKGDSFQCRIMTDQSVRYIFHLRGREQPVIRLETLKGAFNGYIRVLALNSRGNASALQIRMDMAHGTLNGRALKISGGKDAPVMIHGDLSSPRSVFRREDGRTLTADENALLQALFPPASAGRLSDLTGKEHQLPAPGGSWKVQLDPFLKTLAERKIHLNKDLIRGLVTYQGRTRVGKLPCHQFVIQMETDSLKEYDFRLKATFDLEKESPVPVRMKREAREVLARVLPGDDPFSGGSRVTLLSQDQTEQYLIPVREIPRSGRPSGNVPAVQGEWKDLLR